MMLPSSHSSPGSTTPLPHVLVRQTCCTAAQNMFAGQYMPLAQSFAPGSEAQVATRARSAPATAAFVIFDVMAAS